MPDDSTNEETSAATAASFNIAHIPATDEVWGTTHLPSGWIRCLDVPDGKKTYRRRAIYRGPADTLDTADEAVREIHANALLDLSHSRSPGSAVAEITADYTTESGTGTPGEGEDDPDTWATVAPDTVTLTPQTVAVALAAHPKFADKTAKILEINDWLSRGHRFNALSCAGGDADLLSYIGLYEAGVTTWNTVGYSFTVVRHYASDANKAAVLGPLIANSGKVVAWNDIEGHANLGVEPKWLDTSTNGAMPFEWLVGAPAANVVGEELQVTITYQAAWKWPKLLYGGSWDPQPASAS